MQGVIFRALEVGTITSHFVDELPFTANLHVSAHSVCSIQHHLGGQGLCAFRRGVMHFSLVSSVYVVIPACKSLCGNSCMCIAAW